MLHVDFKSPFAADNTDNADHIMTHLLNTSKL